MKAHIEGFVIGFCVSTAIAVFVIRDARPDKMMLAAQRCETSAVNGLVSHFDVYLDEKGGWSSVCNTVTEIKLNGLPANDEKMVWAIGSLSQGRLTK